MKKLAVPPPARDGHFERELRAVTPKAGGFSSQRRLRIVANPDRLDRALVIVANIPGQKGHLVAPDELLGSITEHPCGALVGEGDLVRSLGQQDGIPCQLCHGAKTGLRFAQGFLRLPPDVELFPLVERALHGRAEPRHAIFEDVVPGAVAQGVDGALFADRTGDEDERHFRRDGTGNLQSRSAVERGQAVVRQDDVDVPFGEVLPEVFLRLDVLRVHFQRCALELDDQNEQQMEEERHGDQDQPLARNAEPREGDAVGQPPERELGSDVHRS